MTTYSFSILDDPSATVSTAAFGINDSGQISGQYVDTLGTHGFVYSGGTFNNFDDPSAKAGGTNGFGINALGQVVGYYYDTTSSQSAHGFVYSGGTYTTFDDPSAKVGGFGQGTFGAAINASGQIVGYYTFPNSDNAGFLDSGGIFTTIADPQGYAGGIGTRCGGINNTGEIVGSYVDASGNFNLRHGFLYVGGTFTNFDDPLGAQGTSATGITDAGQIVGTYVDAGGVDHGFLYDGSTFTTLDDPLGTKGTIINGVNNVGQVVGEYFDSSGNEHGFVATPATPDADNGPEPPTLTAPGSLTVPAGGSTPMGTMASPADSDDTVSVTISGVPLFESITAPSGDTVTSQLVHGGGKGDTLTFTITAGTAGQPISGLVLNSSFTGKGHPVNTFTVTASNSTSGETGTAAKTITVTDPPASAGSGPPPSLSDLMSQFGSQNATGAPNQLSSGSVGSLTRTNGTTPDIAALTGNFMGSPFVSGGAVGLLPSSLTTVEEQKAILAFHQG
jgi:probable HAF family extracellular repeat protein